MQNTEAGDMVEISMLEVNRELFLLTVEIRSYSCFTQMLKCIPGQKGHSSLFVQRDFSKTTETSVYTRPNLSSQLSCMTQICSNNVYANSHEQNNLH